MFVRPEKGGFNDVGTERADEALLECNGPHIKTGGILGVFLC